MEYWNDGIMGFEDKKESFSLCDPIFPVYRRQALLQYSIIPYISHFRRRL